MQSLQGKKVLFIAPKFFGYELEIQKEIERRGASVDFVADRPFDKPWQKALTRIVPALLQTKINALYRKKLKESGAVHYDIIFVVNGKTLAPEIVRELKSAHPKAYMVLYMWDSMENQPSVQHCLQYYDKKFTFDPVSAKQYGMNLRPLFFTKGFEHVSAKNNTFDISFIGTMHSDRYKFIKNLRRHLPKDINGFYYLYLQAPWVYWAYKVSKLHMLNAPISDFKFNSITKTEVQTVFLQSKCIVDIEHPRQQGLTMRTFETIGANKKLITTNKHAIEYDFYDANNICVVDRASPKIPNGFFDVPYKAIELNLYLKYSLAGWLDEVLDLKEV